MLIQTTQLDGETSLKPHHAPADTQALSADEIASLVGWIEAEAPSRIFSFSGTLACESMGGEKVIPLSFQQLLLRGAILRNTAWVIGVVVYTGADTKLTRNQRPPPSKFSSLDRRLNYIVAGIFLFMLGLVSTLVILSFFFERASYPDDWYLLDPSLALPDALWWTSVQRFCAYLVILSFIIPQSLWVMLDMVKLGQVPSSSLSLVFLSVALSDSHSFSLFSCIGTRKWQASK